VSRGDAVIDRWTGLVVGWVRRTAAALRRVLRQNGFEVEEA
jgi:hypothetical protein